MVVIECNYERRYSFCNLIVRMFSDFEGVVKARVGHRWVTIETDVIKVKVPLLPRDQLEVILFMLSNVAKRIQEYKNSNERGG
ncbi:hypothetical protein DRN86_03600 [Candidatus Geothermarchaeota archaeon]|nr:MAG: hypothetical protein DRN86_03600 [Candidatus Geothermarchaeota archaeon]